MSVSITFNKYMDNPSLGTSTFTNRSMYRNMYKDKFDKLMVREQGRIAYKIFKTSNATDTYYIVLKIPSETLTNFYYDVVVELSTKNNDYKNSTNLRMYNVKFYSNDQAFIFTFTYAFNKNGLFIPILKSKMLKQCLEEKSLSRNPRSDIWYVKSLCFAFFAMERYNLFTRNVLNQHALKFSQNDLLHSISSAQDKIDEHHKKNEELRLKKKTELEARRNLMDNNLKRNKFSVTTTKTTSSVRTIGRVTNTKYTKHSKRI